MLHIYTGDGFADKEKIIFDKIDPHRKTILIVPDQFSLQAERDAFRLMKTESLTELMIVDFSALGHKVIGEVEGHEPEIIDKYGRHMLLTVLMEDMEKDLKTYSSFRNRPHFIEQVNTMISELKRYEIGVDKLEEVLDGLKEKQERKKYEQTYLTMKLEDILEVYRRYEEAVSGIYQDSEDYITYYAERIPRSKKVVGADVWIYGFDTFTPRNLTVIGKLLSAVDDVSVVLTGDGRTENDPVRSLTVNDGEPLFDVTKTVCERLEALAEETGIPCERHIIEEGRANLWSEYHSQLEEHISLVRTGDHYHEAERAAAYIQHLVRDEGYRYGDIAVICNDAADLGGMLTRALQRMDVPVFSDRRRSVLHQPVVSFLLSFLDVIQKGYQSNGLMGMIKSGMLGIDRQRECMIENYALEFGIRSGRWKKPFQYKSDRYTDDDLELLNETRGFLVDTCDRARDSIGRRNTAEEKIRGLYRFLEEDFRITDRIHEIIDEQNAMGLAEGAAETTQIWNAVCMIFDQMIRVIGDKKISNQTMSEMIRAGLTSMDIGLVPFTGDSLLMGTLQRTRPGQIKALVVVGAEDGLLPLHGHEDGLLTRRELAVLDEMDLELSRREKVSAQEEQLAIYRLFSLPTERIYVSCSQMDSGGSVARPSSLFTKLRKYQGEVGNDLEKSDMMESVVDSNMTISYLAQAMRDRRRKLDVDPRWTQVRRWYEDNAPDPLKRIDRAARFNNRVESLGEDMAQALYVGDKKAMTLSASRLEQFSGCPFAYFIQFGLKPIEQRLFEVGGREIGDVYHQCIMRYCQMLQGGEAVPGETGGAAGSPTWDDITREECHQIIREIMAEERGYREGIFESDEDNKFRMERVTEICGDIAWAVTEQIRRGRIIDMKFEESFGYGEEFPAMEIDIDGKKARIIGRIDRMDVMGDEADPCVRIIDYKTGTRDIDVDEIREGYQLQLAVYMDAIIRAGSSSSGLPENAADIKPAGVFYFKIKEFTKDLDAGKDMDPEKLELEMKKAYRLEGITVSDPAILQNMDRDLLPDSKYESSVVPVKYEPNKESFSPARGGTLMSPDEFTRLLEESRNQAEEICRKIYAGHIKTDPHKTGKRDQYGEITKCRYCDFGSICMFES